jgi:branched-chain amino acid transport system substrate-binding protein
MNSGQFAGGQQRSYETKVPHMLPGVAISTAIFGRFNEYQFPVMLDYWREAQVVVEYIAKKLGGHDKLKNQVIVTMYHDSGYGRQTIEPMKILAEKYGFKDIQIPVAHPGVQQESQWRQVRYEKADWVFFRGWGAMTPVGIKTAQRSGFPVDHIIGDIWATSEDDVRPAGSAAIGYTGVNIFPPGKDYKLLKDIKVALYDKGKGDLDDMNRFGSVYYNFGLLTSLIYSEMIRTAHNEFGVRPITGEEARWAYENLDITQKRIEELGADGLMAPLKLTPCNHQGENLLAKVIQWNGKGWDSTDWIDIDRNLFVPVLLEKAEAAAKDKGIAPRDFQCNYTDKNA